MAAAALVLQFVVLYTPRAPAVGLDGLPLDKLVHVVIFALPTYALVRVGLPVVAVVILMVVQAVGSEVLQHVALANRSGDVRRPPCRSARRGDRPRPAQASISPSISPVG